MQLAWTSSAQGLNCIGLLLHMQTFVLMDNGCQLWVSSVDVARSWDAAPPGGHDAILRWLEHYAHALHHQLACTQLRERKASIGICLYPKEYPYQVHTFAMSEVGMRVCVVAHMITCDSAWADAAKVSQLGDLELHFMLMQLIWIHALY